MGSENGKSFAGQPPHVLPLFHVGDTQNTKFLPLILCLLFSCLTDYERPRYRMYCAVSCGVKPAVQFYLIDSTWASALFGWLVNESHAPARLNDLGMTAFLSTAFVYFEPRHLGKPPVLWNGTSSNPTLCYIWSWPRFSLSDIGQFRKFLLLGGTSFVVMQRVGGVFEVGL